MLCLWTIKFVNADKEKDRWSLVRLTWRHLREALVDPFRFECCFKIEIM